MNGLSVVTILTASFSAVCGLAQELITVPLALISGLMGPRSQLIYVTRLISTHPNAGQIGNADHGKGETTCYYKTWGKHVIELNGQNFETTSNRLLKILDKRPKDVCQIKESKIIAGQAKRVSVKFDPKVFKTIEILHITDVQYGAITCQEARYIEFRDWVLAKHNRFVLFGGDMIDAATVLSVGSPFENHFEPKEQLLKFVELTMPLRHRVLGYVGGNHEARTSKTFGEAGSIIATLLGIPYSNGKQLIDIHFGDHRPFKIDLWHGTGSARTKGAKAQMLSRFMNQGDSSLYLVGHLHDVVLLFDWRQHRSEDGDVKLEKIAGVMSSSFQDFWGGYAERAGLSPSSTMMARCILEPTGKWEITLR